MDDAETARGPENEPAPRRRGLPFRRSHPYYIGFVGGLGVIICFYLAESILVVRTELILILIALLIAVGLNPLVERLTARGLRPGPGRGRRRGRRAAAARRVRDGDRTAARDADQWADLLDAAAAGEPGEEP